MWSKKPFFQRIFFIFPYANFLPTGIQKDEQSHYYNVVVVHCICTPSICKRIMI